MEILAAVKLRPLRRRGGRKSSREKKSKYKIMNWKCFNFFPALVCDLRGAAEVALFGILAAVKVRPPWPRGRNRTSRDQKKNLKL